MFYTCITHDETGEIKYAEHFEDHEQMLKRARQLEAEARRLGPWKCYQGDEPYEAYKARLDDPENADKAAAKAKTISVLTPPEIDDSAEARPVPALALAISAMEAAEQAVLDAKAGADALKKRADNLAEEAYSVSAKSASEEVKASLRRKAVDAQAEADSAAARLYHAEQDLAEKIKAVEALRPKKEGKHA